MWMTPNETLVLLSGGTAFKFIMFSSGYTGSMLYCLIRGADANVMYCSAAIDNVVLWRFEQTSN